MATEGQDAKPAVRFTSENEEIAPEESLEQVQTLTGHENKREREDLGPEAQEELRNLKVTLQKSRQQRRFENFAFEPVSLPASRVPSASSSPHHTPAHSQKASPHQSPAIPAIQSPPLTPAASGDGDRPQEARGSAARTSAASQTGGVAAHPKPTPSFSVGPTGDSQPPSEGASPAVTPGTETPPGTASPRTDPNNAARKQQSSTSGREGSVDSRFAARRSQIFGGSTPGSTLPRSSNASASDISMKDDKRRSFFGKSDEHLKGADDKHHSMSDLKRFFRGIGHKKDKKERTKSPARSAHKSSIAGGTKTPPSREGSVAVPFADDHGLQSKYGKFGKVLGSGAGGSVRLMKRSSDGVTFAVKQFRPRHSYETEKEYSKKVTAEFCIGSTLHHGNIIETMDIVHEKGSWYEVMEYAPFDLFAIVMTGKMSREEVTCCTIQILNGVNYIHSMGLAHRDLKLDNVVVNEHGIMKIIDFGSAAVFRYPFENELVLATGIVGSDPYLAPEVYDLPRYDPRPTDIWSMAIIFCCMTLRRFPWKAPRLSDNSYKLFVAEPDEETKLLSVGGRASQSEPASRHTSGDGEHKHHHHHHHHDDNQAKSEPSSNAGGANGSTNTTSSSTSQAQPSQQSSQSIRGPWRLLRLLPRETRHIVGRMLEVDPKKRATMEEVLEDKWVQGASVCRQEEIGSVVRAPGHDHTLEPGSGGSAPPSKK